MCVFIFRRGDHRSPIAYFSITTPQSALPTATLNGSLTKCLSLRRGGTQCRSGGSYLFSIIFSLLSIISFVRAVIGRPFNTSTLRATNGRPYNTIFQTVYAIFNYLICSATISSTLANASSILLASLPPPCAISGLPPPRPPATAVISLIILPQ